MNIYFYLFESQYKVEEILADLPIERDHECISKLL